MSALVDHRSPTDDDPADVLEPDPDGPSADGAEPDTDRPDTDSPESSGPDAAPAPADVEQDPPAPSPAELRVDFGAHFEANYQRLVAQLYAITLDPRQAHDVVQDAYSRAWRSWATVGRTADPAAWVRRVAVRSTARSWRHVLARVGVGRPRPVGDGVDARTAALLSALGRLPASERRCVVLAHMAGASVAEIAAVEQIAPGTVSARLARARQVVTEGIADVLPEVLGPDDVERSNGDSSAGVADRGLYDTVYDNNGEYR